SPRLSFRARTVRSWCLRRCLKQVGGAMERRRERLQAATDLARSAGYCDCDASADIDILRWGIVTMAFGPAAALREGFESRLVDLSDGVVSEVSDAQRGRWLCEQLELGNILFFPQTPFGISNGDREVLLGQKQTSAAYHKNVA